MNTIPVFSAEISIYNNTESGLRIECSEKYVRKIKTHVNKQGFISGKSNVEVPETQNINNFVVFSVTGGDYNKLIQVVKECLDLAGVKYVEEQFSDDEEMHTRIDTTNLSVFDK